MKKKSATVFFTFKYLIFYEDLQQLICIVSELILSMAISSYKAQLQTQSKYA